MDFTSYALVDARGFVDGYWPAASDAHAAGPRALSRYAADFFAAYLSHDASARQALTAPLEEPRRYS